MGLKGQEEGAVSGTRKEGDSKERRAAWQELWPTMVTLQGGLEKKYPHLTLLPPSHLMQCLPLTELNKTPEGEGAHRQCAEVSLSVHKAGRGAGLCAGGGLDLEDKGFSARLRSAVFSSTCLPACCQSLPTNNP